jgi:hypothetical protein
MMGRSFEVKRADELLDAEFLAKWRDRQALDPFAWEVLATILGRFVASGGPVTVHGLAALFPGRDRGEVAAGVARLDDKDLVLVRDGQILVAYPFAGSPTPFRVLMPGGGERYAVCAIDALGVPALLGEAVTIRSRCHHCGEALEIHARPDGPVGNSGVMVWVGERGEIRDKAFDSL